jgi:hypothetical protein
MPTIQPEDTKKIEILAKIIFSNNRTLSELENLEHMAEFKDVLDMRISEWRFSTANTKNTSKICSVFYQYILENQEYNKEMENLTSTYKKKNIVYLRNQAILLEIKLVKMQEPLEQVARYILNLIILEKELYRCNDISEIDYFTDTVIEFEKMLSYIEAHIENSKEHFKNNGETKSAYLKYCICCINMLENEFESKVKEYITIVSTQIHLILQQKDTNYAATAKSLKSKKHDFEIKSKENNSNQTAIYIYNHIESYIEALILIYFTTYQSIADLEKNTYSIYQLLTKITEKSTCEINKILNVTNICHYMAKKIFSPTIIKMQNKHQTRNEDICRRGIAKQEDFKVIIARFKMPEYNKQPKDNRLWDSIKYATDTQGLKERIDVLSFFQNYAETDDLEFILKTKFKLQKKYINLLEIDQLYEYEATSSRIVGTIRYALSQHGSSIMQHYDAMLMEFILTKTNERGMLPRPSSKSFRI